MDAQQDVTRIYRMFIYSANDTYNRIHDIITYRLMKEEMRNDEEKR